MPPQNALKKHPLRPKRRRIRAWTTLKVLASSLRQPPAIARIAPSYHTVRHEHILRYLGHYYKRLPTDPVPLLNKTLIDIGCGTTPIGCMMALAGADVTAIDPDPLALQAAATDADNFGTPIHFLQLRAEALLTSPARYDIILALDVLAEHPHPSKLLWVLKQLLNPGGVLIVGHTTRSLRAWFIHIFISQFLLGRVPYGTLRWRQCHTPLQLITLANIAGLNHKFTHLLRYSLSGMRWKGTDNRHRATRYLSFFTTQHVA